MNLTDCNLLSLVDSEGYVRSTIPELKLLNMVQIIGYIYKHNALQEHLLYTKILLLATHSVT